MKFKAEIDNEAFNFLRHVQSWGWVGLILAGGV